MPRYRRINWRESDTKELNRVVRNFNDKINRLIKKDPTLKNKLPEKVKASELKKNINTRRDLNRELNKLKRFSRRGAEELVDLPGSEYDLKITKWQRTEMKRMASIVNRARKKRREKLEEIEATSGGLGLGYSIDTLGMGNARMEALKDIKPFTPSMNYRDLHKKYETLLKESQSDYLRKSDQIWKDNYINAIKKQFDNSDPDVIELVEHLEKMDLERWTIKAEAEVDVFEFVYPMSKNDSEGYLQHMRSTWGLTSHSDRELEESEE